MNQLTRLKLKSETGEELEKVEIINTVAAKWKDICIAFEFDATGTQLANLTAQFPGLSSPVEPCRATFMLWLRDGVDVTWKKLLEIITDNYDRHFAMKIERILLKL